jgi:diaminohydroxyphosphoribosylaminopyrimidine deaminase/5-amino-6-(5-phosphoribosylamino)uracil reductase
MVAPSAVTMNPFDKKFMRRALTLARRGLGKTSPNPAVGCVIVVSGQIVGEGWHRKAGTPHAEIHALAQAGPMARGADVYVTLEPCSHFGKTPPCADALIAAGVGMVYVGMVDPNPRVAGKGIEKLQQAGISVRSGILEAECRAINEPFLKHVVTGSPFVTLKSALTLDGMTATAGGDSKWITSERCRRVVHRMRAHSDAIMVGAGTVLIDDPELTVRLIRGGNPLRVVVDSNLRAPLNAKVFEVSSSVNTLVATLVSSGQQVDALQKKGVELLVCSEHEGRIDLHDLLRRLGTRGIQSVLLEGGSELAAEALRNRVIDKVAFFYAPKLVGGAGRGLFTGPGVSLMQDALSLERVRVSRIGEEFLVEGYLETPCSQD